jgi:hypothetical protein
MPSRNRLATATSVGQNSQRLTLSARTRLVSSGIGVKERKRVRDRNMKFGRGNRARQVELASP